MGGAAGNQFVGFWDSSEFVQLQAVLVGPRHPGHPISLLLMEGEILFEIWRCNVATFPALGAPIAVGLKAEELQEVDALGSVVTDIRVHIVPHEFKLVYIKSLDKIHQVCPKVVICRKRY